MIISFIHPPGLVVWDPGTSLFVAVSFSELCCLMFGFQERMTLKHKNTSRWAKRIIKRGLKAHEDGTRDAIMEQLRAHSMLTKKIQSAGFSDSEESSSSSSEEEEDDKEGTSTTKGKSRLLAKAKAATLEALQFDDEAEVPQTGLFALPFMVSIVALWN